MKKPKLLLALLLLVVVYMALPGGNSSAPPVNGAPATAVIEAHRACTADADCVLLPIGCGCCGSGDNAFHYEAANAAHRTLYAPLSQCSPAQKERCAKTNCQLGTPPAASCQAGMCIVQPATVP